MPGEQAGHPRLADDAAAGEDEDVGCDEAATRRQPSERASSLTLLYAIAYVCTWLSLEETAIHIGPRVRALREAMDLSLRDLAQRSGVSAPMLSQVERGETSPTLQSPAASPPGSSCASASCCASTRRAP